MLRTLLLLALVPTLAHAQPICAIQGTGEASPYVGQQVSTEGIVTAVFSGSGSMNGYYIEQPGCDADVNTSNGIFVFAPNPGGIAVGQRVSVAGTVAEYNGLTEITNATYNVLGTGTVTPTDITLPIGSNAQWERYECMLLRFPGQLMVVGNNAWSQYGEVYLAPQRTWVPTDHIDPNDANASGTNYTGASNAAAVTAAQSAIDRSYIVLDDARTTTWPTPAPWSDASGTLRSGSTVNDLRGVLHYSFGTYKVEPTAPVVFQHAARPAVPEVGGTVRAAAFNVLNYFTTLGSWGAGNSGELGRQRTKLVAALQAMNADVLALSEIENSDDAWVHLLAGLNTAMGAGTYAALEEDAFGQGTRTVILYKPAAMTPVGQLYALNTSLFQRPHLTQGFRLNASGGRFLFSTMHLRSKLCDNASGANTDQGDGQGCFNDMRRSQATALIDHWAGVRSATGIDAQLIMGDFNAYTQEDPIDRLRASGLTYQAVDGGYTHSYAGMFGSIDHVFATSAMDQAVSGVAVWHINADEPTTLDYRDSNQSRYQPNAFRSSDHDPVLVGFNGTGLSVGIEEADVPPVVAFALAGRQASWRPDRPGQGMVELFDARGAAVRSVPIAGGLAEADLSGLAPGIYAWRTGGAGVVGRFLLP
ncbi:MAG: ExeM/NucH family extracellular endonuclease [Flavobacteriales bacterium]|nr:ExeM/NucH family extracellular endonuclease [Flavobacteriales bacterium]